MQIRRYLYVNLNEKMLHNYISGPYKRLNFKGIMSFYPLYSLKGKDVVKFMKDTRIGKSNLEVSSFLRIYRAIEEKVVTSGIEATMHPKSNYYNY